MLKIGIYSYAGCDRKHTYAPSGIKQYFNQNLTTLSGLKLKSHQTR